MVPPRKDADDIIKTNPDPTLAVEKSVALAIKNLDEKFTQRMNDNDRAVVLARDEVKTASADLAKAYAEALQAALKTTTEANSKLADSFRNESGATNEKIDRLTERINIWTGRDSNMVESKVDAHNDRSYGLGTAMMIISLIAMGVTIALAVVPHLGK